MMPSLKPLDTGPVSGFRVINSRFPPISLFDDVASADEFAALYDLQRVSNPRLLNEVGNIELLAVNEIPFGIQGCSYATGPFTHLSPGGSRFSDGSYGVLYIADNAATAISEVRHHQELYWLKVPEVEYERFVFRGLRCDFEQGAMLDATELPMDHPIHSPDDYSVSRQLGRATREKGLPGLRYNSVRQADGICWALMTPSVVSSIVQTAHYEMIWTNGRITGTNKIISA